MKIQNVSKVCAAIACALSMSAQAANVLDASQMARGYSSDDINHMMGLVGKQSMKTQKRIALDNGVTKVRFQQMYDGIPVFGYSVAASESTMGALNNVQGRFLDLGNHVINTKPRISAEKSHEHGHEQRQKRRQVGLQQRKSVVYLCP